MSQVSVIIPCFNEQSTIRLLLDALAVQTFPHNDMEIIIADGMSTDDTRFVIETWKNQNPDLVVRIVENRKRNIPSGINRAIEAAEGEIIIRLDAHSIPNKNYIELCVGELLQERGDNVGGIWRIVPGGSGPVARAIAAVAAHPLGVGGAQYRIGGEPKAVDTVPFGAFRRELVNQIGFFDETLLSNEDYEYNARIRKTGGVVWFDPEIQSTYIARSTIRDLALQYWRYGFWKLQMLRKYPRTIRLRQALPPLLVLGFWGLAAFALWFLWARVIFILFILVYSSMLMFAGLQLARKHRIWQMLALAPLMIITMHFSWGTGFLWSLIKSLFGGMEN